MHDDKPQGASHWRKQHGDFVSTATERAGVFAEQAAEAREPCIVDWLAGDKAENRPAYLTRDQYEALSEYRNDVILARWRSDVSPPASAYGEVRGGNQGEVTALARQRVIAADGFITATVGTAAQRLLRNVADDLASLPKHNGAPYWWPMFRPIAGRLVAWRRMDPDDIRALRLQRLGA